MTRVDDLQFVGYEKDTKKTHLQVADALQYSGCWWYAGELLVEAAVKAAGNCLGSSGGILVLGWPWASPFPSFFHGYNFFPVGG